MGKGTGTKAAGKTEQGGAVPGSILGEGNKGFGNVPGGLQKLTA